MRSTLGRYPEMSIEQARRLAAGILSEIAEGGNPAEVKRALKGEQTFGELYDIYYERHAKVHKKTYLEDKQRYEQYLEKPLGNKKLSAITKEELTKLHSKITSDGHPVVANRVLALLSSIFNRGIAWSISDSNPSFKIRRNKETSRDRYLTSIELKPFITALNAEENITIRDFLWISLLTGARRDNVLCMQWAEINFTDGIWRIPDTKNGTPQNVHLPESAIILLKQRQKLRKEKELFVFPGKGKTGHLVEPKTAWANILKKAKISALRIHDLRRTLGSWQIKTGATLAVIGKSLNHKNVQTTAIYARLDLDPVKDSVNTATDAILKAGGVTKNPLRSSPAPRKKAVKKTAPNPTVFNVKS
jgi:integrase